MEKSESIIRTEIIATIAGAERVLVAAHRSPDGDAVGSLLGMYFILRALKKKAVAFCPDSIPPSLAFLPGAGQIEKHIKGSFDATILLDTPERSLFPDGFESRGTFIVVDHHACADDFGDLVLRKPAAAVGELLYYLAKDAGWPVDAQAAICLYTSIVADTSSFKYESATPRAHLAAADLMERGADPKLVSTHLFESFSAVRQRLMARVLETLTVAAAGKYACLYCSREMMETVGASPDDLEGMVNSARSVGGVELAALLREEDDGNIRVSLRSKGRFDAAAVAAHFGGGGHVNAAGFRFERISMAEARELLRRRAEEVLGVST